MPGVKGEIAPIYAEAAKIHVTPPELDLCEIWQIASMFAVDLYLHDHSDDMPAGVGDMRQGWIDPNVINRAKRAMGHDAPDVKLGGYHPDLGVLA
jgi:hypothetical protein